MLPPPAGQQQATDSLPYDNALYSILLFMDVPVCLDNCQMSLRGSLMQLKGPSGWSQTRQRLQIASKRKSGAHKQPQETLQEQHYLLGAQL